MVMIVKKVILLCFVCLFSFNVYAYDFDYEKDEDGLYVLSITDLNEHYSYEEAFDKYKLSEYMIYTIEDKDYYFRMGKEISKEEYDNVVDMERVKQNCNDIGDSCIIVTSTDEIIKRIDALYASKNSGLFYLMYAKSDYTKINFNEIYDYYEKKYLSESEQNMYKYDEYAFLRPERFLPHHDENKLIIDLRSVKTNDEEVSKVDEFLDEFLKLFDNKSEYEKILGVYTYINNTAKYEKDDGYINFMDGQLSAYDVLIKHKTVCIGASTTFQLLMERLGVESYIVDHVSSNTDSEYITTHTYNIVKLEDKWYIVDIAFDDNLSGLLKGISDNYSLEDFKYYNIEIANKNYFDEYPSVNKKFDFDYAKLLDLTEKIDRKESMVEKDNKLDDKKSYLKEYILIGVILIVILGIIYIFTRQK